MRRIPLLLLFLLVSPSLYAGPPDLTAWLYQHPEISGSIIWDFPDEVPDLPASTSPRTVSPWMQKAFLKKSINLSTGSSPSSAAGNDPCAGGSCPAYTDFSPGPGKTIQWYYWPPDYKQRLQSYFNRYWNWMELNWPLYQQYKQSGFAQKPAGFEEKFGAKIDPDTGALPQNLPIVAEQMHSKYTSVLYEPSATVDLYLKTTAMQLVLEMGDFLEWKLSDYSPEDLAVALDGRNLFRYYPANSKPWGGTEPVGKEGYDATQAIPAPPLVQMNFLFNEGILRDTRLETIAQLLEWERFNLQHAMGNPQTLTGECGKEFNEVYWGTKGQHTIASMLHGTVMLCPLVPQPGSDTNGFYTTELKHFTGGCGGTGGFSHRVLRQINLVAEPIAFTHGQSRFVVEKTPFEQMLAGIEPQLPLDPAIQDGLSPLLNSAQLYAPGFQIGSTSPKNGRDRSSNMPLNKLGGSLVNAYLDHNDNPYGMASIPEIPVKHALLSEANYQKWFKKPPEGLSDEQRSQYMSAHDKRVSLRPDQLRIAFLPLHTFKYYCWKEDAGKPHAETETYDQFFASTYTPEELEATGFWTRFETKLTNDFGGCEGVPPMW